MNKASESLFWPSLIIGVGFVASMAFVFVALKNYKKPTPLVIKPSSVTDTREIAEGFHKALYPLTQTGVHFNVLSTSENSKGQMFKNELQKNLNEFFKPSDKEAVNLNIIKVSLSDENFNLSSSCGDLSLFNLRRKKERVWDKSLIFTLCKESEDSYLLIYDQKDL